MTLIRGTSATIWHPKSEMSKLLLVALYAPILSSKYRISVARISTSVFRCVYLVFESWCLCYLIAVANDE